MRNLIAFARDVPDIRQLLSPSVTQNDIGETKLLSKNKRTFLTLMEMLPT